MAFDRDAFLRERETLQNLTTKYEKVFLVALYYNFKTKFALFISK
jgi:hypothetical protein